MNKMIIATILILILGVVCLLYRFWLPPNPAIKPPRKMLNRVGTKR